MSSSVGGRIKKLRLALNLTQAEFAEKIGVKGGVVSAWENGNAPLPQGRLLIICGEYGVNSDWILKGEGEMFSDQTAAPKSNRDAALEYARSILEKLPEETRSDAVEFLRELARLCDEGEGVVKSDAKSELTDGDTILVPSADDDFNDDEGDEDDEDYEEFDLEEDYDD